jgi:hypothetical protein
MTYPAVVRQVTWPISRQKETAISHDLKTPITHMRLRAKILDDAWLQRSLIKVDLYPGTYVLRFSPMRLLGNREGTRSAMESALDRVREKSHLCDF